MSIAVPIGSPVLGDVDIRIWRTSNRPRPIWRFGMNLGGSTMVLSVRWRNGGFETTTLPDEPHGSLELLTQRAIDPAAEAPPDPLFRDVVRWNFSDLAVSKIPLGRIAQYRLDRQVRGKDDGEFRAYRTGYFIGRGLHDA